jgi:hypothetical protein
VHATPGVACTLVLVNEATDEHQQEKDGDKRHLAKEHDVDECIASEPHRIIPYC